MLIYAILFMDWKDEKQPFDDVCSLPVLCLRTFPGTDTLNRSGLGFGMLLEWNMCRLISALSGRPRVSLKLAPYRAAWSFLKAVVCTYLALAVGNIVGMATIVEARPRILKISPPPTVAL